MNIRQHILTIVYIGHITQYIVIHNVFHPHISLVCSCLMQQTDTHNINSSAITSVFESVVSHSSGTTIVIRFTLAQNDIIVSFSLSMYCEYKTIDIVHEQQHTHTHTHTAAVGIITSTAESVLLTTLRVIVCRSPLRGSRDDNPAGDRLPLAVRGMPTLRVIVQNSSFNKQITHVFVY